MNPRSPLVLLTNDDGVDATGIAVLADAFRGIGARVVVVAPRDNHTAGSHRVTLFHRVSVARVGESVYACSGTPADCVRLAVLGGFLPRPQLVVSGVNHGANAGEDIHYSGTVAAAAEGALLGVPAVAISQDGDGGDLPFLTSIPRDFVGVELAADLALRCLARGLPGGTLVNINLPREFRGAPAGRWCAVGRRDWAAARMTRVLAREGAPTVYDPWAVPPRAVVAAGSDYEALRDGRASLNLLSVEGGLHDVLDVHRAWTDALTLRPTSGAAPRPTTHPSTPRTREASEL